MIAIAEQIACVRRELAMRERVYPRRVADKRMTAPDAKREMARMQAVLDTLLAVERGELLPDIDGFS